MAAPLVRLPARSRTASIPIFLAPAFAPASSRASSSRLFSTSPVSSNRRVKGSNKKRGISVIHSTDPRRKTWAYTVEMPEPNLDPDRRAQYTTPKDHGLYAFFNEKRDAILTPTQEGAHGRAWEVSELEQKSWDDLYRLWWVCHKEANAVSTRSRELGRLRAGFGFSEVQDRLRTVSYLISFRSLFRHWHSSTCASIFHDESPTFTRRYERRDRLNPCGLEHKLSWLIDFALIS
jgi:large subunit ribosomal protein L47